MAIMDDELYIGTTIGSLIIVEASKMRPITVFRPFEEEIKIIIPVNPNRLVTFSNQTNEFENEQDSDHDCNDISLQTDKRSRYLITIGKGYRCLFDRYLNPTAEHHQPLVTHPGLHALLWSADSWLMWSLIHPTICKYKPNPVSIVNIRFENIFL